MQRDLACHDLWAESLARSRALRAEGPRNGRRSDAARSGGRTRGRPTRGTPPPLPAIELPGADARRRDLTDAELWEWSQRRSRERRELAEAQGFQIPARSTSVAALVALTAGPVAGVAVAKVITSGDGGSGHALVLPVTAADSNEPASPSAPATPARHVEQQPAAVESESGPAGHRRQASVGRVHSSMATVAPRARATATDAIAPSPTPTPKATSTPAAQATRAAHEAAGGGVRALQQALGVPTDGDFGPKTEAALKRWQSRHGLEADGVAGPQTRSAVGLGDGRVLERKPPRTEHEGSGHTRAKHERRSGGSSKHSAGRRHGGGVADLQRAIGVSPDGDFGPATERALKRWQRRHGLVADGVAGPQTRRALGLGQGRVLKRKHSRSRHAGSGHKRAGQHGRHGGGVADLQRAIGVSADGVFGPATERALKRWQRRHGLVADGVAGPQTRRALGLGLGPILKRRHHGGRRRHSSGGGSSVVQRVIAAANAIATKPYKYGGGHGSWTDSGYDCSGSVSYALHGGGLLSSPLDSSGFMSYGAPGPGRHITIYANSGHVYMTIDGRRFDTSARSETGSRWTSTQRSSAGYVVRHLRGL